MKSNTARDTRQTQTGLPENYVPRVDDRSERAFVFGIWFLLTVLLLVYIWLYGSPLPYWDDWQMMDGLKSGHFPRPGWFWEQNNEHRYPIARLLTYASWSLVHDLRPVIVINDMLLSVSVLVLLKAVIRVRGRAVWEDAFIPFALLTWADFENILFCTQHLFVGAASIGLIVFAILLENSWRERRSQLWFLMALVVALPLYGAIGLVLVQPFVVWALGTGFIRGREGGERARGDAALLFATAGGAVLMTAVYFIGYQPPAAHSSRAGILQTVVGIGEVLTTALGTVGAEWWPYSAIFVSIVVASGIAIAVLALLFRAQDRTRSLGLLAAAASFFGFAGASSFGRVALGIPLQNTNRYMIYSASLLVVCYCAFQIFSPERLGRFVGMALFLTVSLVTLPNCYVARDYGTNRLVYAQAVISDANSGLSSEAMAQLSVNRIFPKNEPYLAAQFEALRQRRYPPFSHAPAARTDCNVVESVHLGHIMSNDLTWSGEYGIGTGNDPFVVYSLGAPTRVCGIRVTYTLDVPGNPQPRLKAYWMLTGRNGFAESERVGEVSVEPGKYQQTAVFWVDDVIDLFRLDPDSGPVQFRVLDISLIRSDSSQ